MCNKLRTSISVYVGCEKFVDRIYAVTVYNILVTYFFIVNDRIDSAAGCCCFDRCRLFD